MTEQQCQCVRGGIYGWGPIGLGFAASAVIMTNGIDNLYKGS